MAVKGMQMRMGRRDKLERVKRYSVVGINLIRKYLAHYLQRRYDLELHWQGRKVGPIHCEV